MQTSSSKSSCDAIGSEPIALRRILCIIIQVLWKVALVTAYCHHCLFATVIAEKIDPGLQVDQRFGACMSEGSTREIEDEDGAYCIFEVAWYEAAIAFLTCSVPQLQATCGGIMRDIFAKKIDSDGGLGSGCITLSFSSNLLLTNLYMMLVLPVLVSPRSMTLKVLLPMVEEVMDMYGEYLNYRSQRCRNSNIIINPHALNAPFDLERLISEILAL